MEDRKMTDTIGTETGHAKPNAPTVNHWINGREVAPGDDAWVPGINPADGSTAAMIASGTAADVESAVAAAVAAGPGWRWMPSLERARLLDEVARQLRAQAEEFAALESRISTSTRSASPTGSSVSSRPGTSLSPRPRGLPLRHWRRAIPWS
jgi:delta 1-pyrroline-5-carboxylate dehydrogenase